MKVEEGSLINQYPYLGISRQAVLVLWERCRDTAQRAYNELLQLGPDKGIVPVLMTLSQIERYRAEATLDQIMTEVIMRQLQKPAWQVVVGELPEITGLQSLLNRFNSSHNWLRFSLLSDCSPDSGQVANNRYHQRIYNGVMTVRGLQSRLETGTSSTLIDVLFLSRKAFNGFQKISESKTGRLEPYAVYG